jgi:hypothetical protein
MEPLHIELPEISTFPIVHLVAWLATFFVEVKYQQIE